MLKGLIVEESKDKKRCNESNNENEGTSLTSVQKIFIEHKKKKVDKCETENQSKPIDKEKYIYNLCEKSIDYLIKGKNEDFLNVNKELLYEYQVQNIVYMNTDQSNENVH